MMDSYTESKLKHLVLEADNYRNKYYKLCDWLEFNYPKVIERYWDYEAVTERDDDNGN